MSDNDQKSKKLIMEAKNKIESTKSIFSFFFNTKTNKIEEAIELYQKAGNLLRLSKKWNEAGDVMCEIANLHSEIGTKHEVAMDYVSAANSYKKIDKIQAINCLSKAAEIYTDIGRFILAAKQHQSIAEMYEIDNFDVKKCVDHYEQAADYFKSEENNISADKCLQKVAKYAANFENYEKAIQIYENMGINSLHSNLMKYTAKDNFFRSVLCHLCIDVLNAKYALEKYREIFPGFPDSREFKFVSKLIDQIEENNEQRFTDVVRDFDSISRLDSWYTMILLRIKKHFNNDIDLR